MASANVVTFTDDNFEAEVVKSPIPVLVDFWAEWCFPCRALAPTIDELADEYAGKLKVGKVDTDSNRNIAINFGITSIPTVMIFKDGQMVKRWVGLQSKRDLKAALNEIVV